MPRIEAIRRPPVNFDAFVDEVSAGLVTLYGPAAAEDYRKKAPSAISTSLAHPAVRAWAAFDDAPGDELSARALVVSAQRDGVGHITFVHVLKPYVGRGIEGELARAAVAELRACGVLGISAEPVALCPLELDGAFGPLGFQRIERQLMDAPLNAKPLSGPLLSQSVPADSGDYVRVADIIVDAYSDHPGRDLHAEVRTPAGAESFVRTAAEGAYGMTRPGFIRLLRRSGTPVAAVVGCEAAPGIGFVLQVVVRPEAQGQGIGTQLMREIAQCFRDAGLSRVALGVTNDNPARRLYERLGFRKIMPVNAYVWWR
ncbi:MAG: GNAT family N-acetyltransferase [Candidatus Hydrogenedentes bacterium]|nr:GNAT family N-acetyltransferase [Candidatus Hydrogenedentota bacterium]